MLSSGIFGKVVEVREKEFLVEIAENVRILVLKEAVANVIDEEKKEESK
jgi:preprotein translocase subunit YajC